MGPQRVVMVVPKSFKHPLKVQPPGPPGALPRQVFSYDLTQSLPVSPEISPFEFANSPVDAEDFVTLSCAVTKGDFPLEISWMHNNRNITPADGITTTRISKRLTQLSIDSVQAHHAGSYTCTARNPAGAISHSAVLNVNGATPVAPRTSRIFRPNHHLKFCFPNSPSADPTV